MPFARRTAGRAAFFFNGRGEFIQPMPWLRLLANGAKDSQSLTACIIPFTPGLPFSDPLGNNPNIERAGINNNRVKVTHYPRDLIDK